MVLLSFKEALKSAQECSKRHILLGNGFSISCRPKIFAYGKLYEQADFSEISATAKQGFEALGTQDFERVIKALRDSSKIIKAYERSSKLPTTLQEDADGLRELLVKTIAASHPAWPGEITELEYESCRKFLAPFNTIYTFNYDLLLYWAQMHTPTGAAPTSDDGFRTPEHDFEPEYVVWEPGQSHDQNMWFLHGALHVFDTGTEIRKYTWKNTGVRLITQIRDALRRDYFPLFVSEGTSEEKYERIRHNDYLAKAYRSFSEISGALFIYGHSLAPQDEHYLKRIEKGKISRLYIGIHGDPTSEANRHITRRAEQMSNSRRHKTSLSVSFYDTATANVWGK